MFESGHAFFSSMTFSGSVWVHDKDFEDQSDCLIVPQLFRADSGTNLIKKGEMSKDNQVVW